MAKDKKFVLEEFSILKDVINKNEKNLIGGLSGYKKEFRDISSIISSTLNASEKDIKAMMSSSKEFENLVEEIKQKCNELNNIVSEIGESANNIKTDYSLSDDEFNKYIKYLAKYEKNKKQINELNSLSSLNSRQQALKDKLDNENQTIANTFTTSGDARVRDLFSEKDNDDNIKKYIKGLNDVEEKTKNIHITSKKVTESYEKGVEALERQNKTLEAVKQGVEYVFGYVSKGFDKWREINEKVYTVGRQIGLSTKELRNYQINVMNNYDNLASKLGMTFEELFKFQETYTKNTGRAIGLTNEQVLSLGTMSKLVGDVATNDMVKNMDDFGASTQTATSYLALNMARAKSQGLDAQKASEAFSKNVKLAASHNFREGVNGISKMTLLSQKLKFNMDSIANAADKFETIEGAIGTSANLQVLGGSFAAQFGNPLEAMNMAMLDMEGFTNKIVDTFSNKAIFNRETGQVEMSAIDKRFLKEAAKQLGISYDEAWNMASQQAKISDIERQIGLNTTSFTDKEKDFITSKAQYDAETKQHYVTVYQDGEAKQVNVKDLTSTQLEIMRDQKDVEHAMYSDVHGIHEKLSKYVGEDLSKNKSFNESIKGMDESIKINFADIHDEYMSPIVKPTATWLSDSNWWIAALGLGAVGTSIGYFFKDALSNIFKDIGNFIKGGINNRNQSQNTSQSGRQQPQQPQGGRQQPQQPQGGQRRTPKAKSKLFKGGIGRSLNRIGLKTLGKNGLKTLGKRIPYIGTAIAAVGGIMDASNAISSYNQKKMEIENSNLTEKEKAIAKTEAKREKNKSVGGAVGSTGGALGGAALGAAIGSFILPGVGTVIGGALGGWLGEKAGKSVGEAVGSAVTSKQQYNNSLRNNSLYNDVIYGNNSVVSRPNTYYNTKSFIDNISVKNNNNDIISKPTAGEYQYIRETNNYQQQSFNNGLINNKLDLNVSGTIKLTSDRGNSVDIDLNKLLNNPSFINQLTTMISNEMNKRSNFGVGKDYNSVSHIMGGASSRSVLNATTNGAK